MLVATDCRSHPVLVHCRSGKHRTGSLIGVLRKVRLQPVDMAGRSLIAVVSQLLMWEESDVMEEYVKFSTPKERALDMEYIRRFDLTQIIEHLPAEDCLPLWARSAVDSLKSLAAVSESSPAAEEDETKRDWRLGIVGDPFRNLDRTTEDAQWYTGALPRNASSASPASVMTREEKDGSDSVDETGHRVVDASHRQRSRAESTTSSSSSGADPDPLKKDDDLWFQANTTLEEGAGRPDVVSHSPVLMASGSTPSD